MNTMKTYSFALLFLILSLVGNSQTFQATVLPGTAANSVILAVRPGSTLSNAQMSSAQFALMVPAGIGMPIPTAIVRKADYITGMGFVVAPISTETTPDGNFYVFNIDGVGGSTVPTMTFNSGVNYNLIEIQFLGRPDVSTSIRLAQLPNGGTTSNSNFYLAMNGVDVVNQAAQFFATGATTASNDGQGYSGFSYVTSANIILPVRWLSFSAVRQVNDALVSWSVDNDANNEKYIVERSFDGSNFTTIGEINKRIGSGTKRYDLLDKNITSTGNKIIYYRVKSVETNSRYTYTETKNIRLDLKGQISLFPIPARDGFTLTIPYLNPSQAKVQLHLLNAVGQVVERKDITRAAAVNYYYNLQSSLITSGEYMLKIFEDGQLTETKRVLIKK